MTDYVTATEAQRWHDGLGIKNHADADRLMRTVVHQAEQLAEAREVLWELVDLITDRTLVETRAVERIARDALARLDSQEAKNA